MAILDNIHLDFQVINTGDPKVLVISDTSVWGAIEDKPSIVEIIIPGSSKVRTYNFVKGKSNVFNSSNLLITSVGTISDLSDGVYDITVKGSPDINCKQRYFLKADKFQLALDKLYMSLGVYNKNAEVTKQRNDLLNIDSLLKTAEAFVRDGKPSEGLSFFKKAYTKLNDLNDCNNC
jgi:hypothetical protein